MRIIIALFILLPTIVLADARYCGEPKRDGDGSISRSASVVRQFRAQHPCPSTGKRYGACPNWAVDHVIPLKSCGCDSVENMQWLPNAIKSCSGVKCKDRWERKVYQCQG